MAASNVDGTVRINTKIDTSGAEKGLQGLSGRLDGIAGKLKVIGGLVASVFAVRRLVQFSKECIQIGSDLEEVQNVVDVTFGKMSGTINEFAKTAATQFGLSELAAKQYSSTMGAMLKSMGVGEAQVTDMSIAMAELSADMASFYNLSNDVAFQKIRAGIAGETEPLKQLGINMSAANLEAFRLAQGISTTYNAMSQSEKTMLRYQYLLSVTKDAQGDFARTSGSWANQTKILNLQLQTLKANIGQGLINLLTPALQMINKVLSALTRLASAFKSFSELITGKKASSPSQAVTEISDDLGDAATSAADYADATDDTAKATKAAVKAAKSYESPLDHIHKMQEDTASTTPTSGTGKTKTPTSTPATSSALSRPIDYGSMAEGGTVIDKLAVKMKEFYDLIIKQSKPAREAAERLWETFKKGGKWVLDNVLAPLAKWTVTEVMPRFFQTLGNVMDIFNNVLIALQPLWQWFWDNVLKPVIDFTASAFLTAWDGINKALKTFGDWCKNNPGTIRTITIAVGAFLAAWKIVGLIGQLGSLVMSISAVGKAVLGIGGTFLKAAFANPWVLVIAGVIAAVLLIATNWDKVKASLGRIWGNIKQNASQTWSNIKDTVSRSWNAIKIATSTTWNSVKSFVGTVWSGIKSTAIDTFSNVGGAVKNAWQSAQNNTSKVWSNIKKATAGALDTIMSKANALSTIIPNAFSRAFGGLVNIVKAPINGVIGAINGMIRGLVAGINGITSSMNSIRFSIPSWVPGFGGNSFGLNIPPIFNYPQIPYLASGAVIPPNSQFLAMLGDQKQGNNLEAPEGLIRRIVREESGGKGRYQFIAQINRRTIFDQIIEEAKIRQGATGLNPFEMA